MAAARVGGIHANSVCPADFIRDNLLIQTHIIDNAWKTGVERLMFLGSSCVYPSWRLDETYVKVRGKWTYMYRAVDKRGDTIAFYLLPSRTAKAAQRLVG